MAIDVYDEVPPSPTLTNPDMILPSLPGDTILNRIASPQQQQYFAPQPYSDPNDPTFAFANFSSYAPALLPAKAASSSAASASPPVLVRSASPTASTDTTPTRRAYGPNGDVLASSPTLRLLGPGQAQWPLVNGRPSSGLSDASSDLSEDLERWAANKAAMADMDGAESVVTVEEDEGHFSKYASRSRPGDAGSSPLSQIRDDADEDFLSRRAEIILANAKSRLKMMEGNLKGARHSLSNNSMSNRYSVASSKAGSRRVGSATHSRSVSEVSLPIALPPLPSLRAQAALPKRSSSALGNFGPGLHLLGKSGPLRGARSQEVMRENRLKNWMLDERDRNAPPSYDSPRASVAVEQRPVSAQRKSPTPSEMHRPVSQASSIRAQMDELKGRIHQIKERANQTKRSGPLEHELKSAQIDPPESTDTADAWDGVAQDEHATFLDDEEDDDDDDWLGASEVDVQLKHRPSETPDYEESTYEDAEETLDDLEGTLQDHRPAGRRLYSKHSYGQLSSLNGVIEEEGYDRFEGDSESGATEYFEAEQVMAERHEDRFDAFDYQNMFLHSAMSSAYGRRGSYSSDSSVETTRPASPLRSAQNVDATSPDDTNYFADDPPPSGNRLSVMPDRNMSSASISTAASFATAVGDGDDDYEDELANVNGGIAVLDAAIITAKLDKIARPTLTIPRHDAPIPSPQRSPNAFSTASSPSKKRGSTLLGSPPAYLPSPPKLPSSSSAGAATNQAGASLSQRSSAQQHLRPSSGLLTAFIGLDNVSASQETIQRDRALVEGVVSALQRCCLELQRAPEERRAVLRERLAEVKRGLAEVVELAAASSPRPMSS